MEKDETVMVFEEKTNSNGQVRVKCKDGWTSVTSQHGTTLLQRIDEGAQKDANEKKHAHFKTEVRGAPAQHVPCIILYQRAFLLLTTLFS